MELLAEYGLFLLQTLTIVLALILVIGAITRGAGQQDQTGTIRITDLSKRLEEQCEYVQNALKEAQKSEREPLGTRLKKVFKKKKSSEATFSPKSEAVVVVLKFNGDMKASQVTALRQEVTAILSMAAKPEKVLLKLTSPGGLVHTYGLASSQLSRLSEAKIPLAVCVDTVAASGGYMMAVCADEIIAAPFAVLGSIGVVAQIPNINKFLKNRDVDIELHTAGENKRTLTLLGENTPEGRKKFKDDLNRTHDLFKAWIAHRRPKIKLDEVADGSIFYGTDALKRGLCDRIATSDDILLELSREHHLIGMNWLEKKTLMSRLGRDASAAIGDQINSFLHRSHQYFARL